MFRFLGLGKQKAEAAPIASVQQVTEIETNIPTSQVLHAVRRLLQAQRVLVEDSLTRACGPILDIGKSTDRN